MITSLSWARSRGTSVLIGGVLALAVALVVIVSFSSRIDSSSFVGELFGTAAALAMVVVMAYSGRRSLPAVRALGPTRWYLDIHIAGGILFLALLLLHTGFRLPRAGLTIALWIISMWVVVSGLAGWWLQRTLPKLLEPSASFEAHAQRIPEFVAELRRRAEALARSADPAVKTYYDERIAASLTAPRFLTPGMFGRGISRRGRGRESAREIDILRRTLEPRALETLEKITELSATKHELDVHFTIQRLLQGWLVFHLPVAIGLVILVALHVFFVVYY